MNDRYFKLPVDVCTKLWAVVASIPPLPMPADLALQIQAALQASTGDPVPPPLPVTPPPPPWGTPAQPLQPDAANLDALRHVVAGSVAGTGGVGAIQSPAALASAAAYEPIPPAEADRGNPLAWAYREFLAAGFKEVSAPNGPLERWGAQVAMGTSWVDSFKIVARNYAAGSANIGTGAQSAESRQQWLDAQKLMQQQPPPAAPPATPPAVPPIEEGGVAP